jgi:uncharacterized protein (TIGR03435 family)
MLDSRVLRLYLLLLASSARSGAQAATTVPPPAKTPAYDVATIKPSKPGSDNVDVWTRPATLITHNVPFRDLLQDAFHVRKQLVFGLPAWAESARYDIEAKVVEPDMAQLKALTPDQRRAMIRMLLEDRFGLKWHFETRVMSDYELVVGKDGPKFKPSAGDSQHNGTSMNNTDLTVTNVPLSQFTDILSAELEKPVVDKTGLTAHYDFHLRWTRDEAAASSDKGTDTGAPPPLFTALQEQLGLKLQSGKDPVQVLVVDEIKPPSED